LFGFPKGLRKRERTYPKRKCAQTELILTFQWLTRPPHVWCGAKPVNAQLPRESPCGELKGLSAERLVSLRPLA
jgi:hypothetical protein